MSLDNHNVEEIRQILTTVSSTGEMTVSFSQLGEDRILWWLFAQRKGGFYVDIGCHKPYRFSNTASLYLENGWSGLNVDMDERSLDAFRRARPDDINVCAAIGGKAGIVEATFFIHGEFNTLDPHIGASAGLAGFLKERRQVEVLPLGELLDRYLPKGQTIDFMNVDIEGLDYQALLSNDWDRFSPEVIAVEIHGFDLSNPGANPTVQLLWSKGYELLAHLVATSIFRRRAT